METFGYALLIAAVVLLIAVYTAAFRKPSERTGSTFEVCDGILSHIGYQWTPVRKVHMSCEQDPRCVSVSGAAFYQYLDLLEKEGVIECQRRSPSLEDFDGNADTLKYVLERGLYVVECRRRKSG